MPTRVLEDWYHRIVATQKGHYLSADHFNRKKFLLGIPVMTLTTLVGTSVFATLQAKPEPWLQILTGLASVLAALLASLQTFLGFAERAEKHRVAGAKFGALGRQLEQLMDVAGDPSAPLSSIREKLDALAIESPNVPLRIYRAAKMSAYEEARAPEAVAPAKA